MCSQPGFSSSTMRFHSLFPFFWFAIWQSASHFFYTPWTLLLLKDQGVALGHSAMHVENRFATSSWYAFDQHRRSGYLIGTGCHVLDDGSTRSLLVATARPNMSTAMLQKLKMKPKHHCMIPRHFGNEISTLSNSLWKNYLDDLDCIEHL